MSTLAQSTPFVAGQAGHSRRQARIVRAAAWLAAAGFGMVQVLATPYRPSSEDIVSYLDIADAYRRHEWRAAINGYWSPLYSWVLALAESIVHPPPAWELAFVRLVNFLILFVALAAFEFFLEQVIAAHVVAVSAGETGSSRLPIPSWMWRVSGYSVFLWSSLVWTGLRTDTPDLCAAALVLVAAGLLVRARTTPLSYAGAIGLGVVAGLSYLARTANFPIALLFIACLAGSDVRRSVAKVSAALGGCLLVSLPFITGLSLVKHRFTIGESGRMNYVWNVNPGGYIVPGLHWQGGPAGSGGPIHPTRRIWSSPEVFEFEHGAQTYPPWTDPSYWYDGLQVRFSAAAQLRAVLSNAQFFGWMFLPAVAALYAVLLAAGGLVESVRALVVREWRLLLIAGFGLATYMFGTNLSAANIPTQPSTRYVAVFVIVLFAAMASSIRLRDSTRSRTVLIAGTVIVAVLLVGQLVLWSRLAITTVGAPVPAQRLWDVVVDLRAAGIGPGSPVAILGRKGQHEFWARLGRIRIIEQIPDPEAFLHADSAVQEQVLDVLAGSGATALVADEVAIAHRGQAWQRLGATGYSMIDLAGRDTQRTQRTRSH